MPAVVLILAVGLGLGGGWLLQRVPLPRLVQDIAAMVIGSVLGALTALFKWDAFLPQPESGGIGAFALDPFDPVQWLAVLLLACGLHFGLRAVGHAGHAVLSKNHAVIVAGVGALLGVVRIAVLVRGSAA
jgi:hypothetical protein